MYFALFFLLLKKEDSTDYTTKVNYIRKIFFLGDNVVRTKGPSQGPKEDIKETDFS